MRHFATILIFSVLFYKGTYAYPENVLELMGMVEINDDKNRMLDELVPLGEDENGKIAMTPRPTLTVAPPTQAPGLSGTTYTRWGSDSCPDIDSTELVYAGVTGGSYFYNRGGASNYLCMPLNGLVGYSNELKYSSPTNLGYSFIYGTEYERPVSGRHNHNVPCAVCETTRPRQLLIPASFECPDGWTREYFGYLMSAHVHHFRTTFVCVDEEQKSVSASCHNTNGALFYHVKAAVHTPAGIAKGHPYEQTKELNCVVCTK